MAWLRRGSRPMSGGVIPYLLREANVKQGNGLPVGMGRCGRLVLVLLLGAACGWAQETKPPAAVPDQSMSDAVHELQEQVRELRAAVAEVRTEAAQYRAETLELRHELEANRQPPAATMNASTAVPPGVTPSPSAGEESQPAAASLEQRVASLEEASQLQGGKVDEQYQTKIEGASKYRVRLSGLVLMNLFSNRGTTDNPDFPTWADPPGPFDSNGNFGATLRQSELGLEVFGPRLAGAKTTANLQFDFSGGFANTSNGNNFGLVRMRIASMRLDWDHTSVVVGQDNLFLSPLSPTSFASLAIPALGYAGNLWGWIPQVRVEHRFDLSPQQSITVQGGIIDNVTGEFPYDPIARIPQAGEKSSQPAFGARVAWTGNIFGQPITLGSGGYYSRQNWGFDHHVDGWAGMTDWDIPLTSRVRLSGEFYRGRAVAGLSGAIGTDVVLSSGTFGPTTQVRGLNSMGGWAQLKLKATSKLEFNGAFGVDNPFASDFRAIPGGQVTYTDALTQNRSTLVNFIYRPRSNLLFSTEYRHLRTSQLDNGPYTAEQINLIMGILF
jgi:hypothetical protein